MFKLVALKRPVDGSAVWVAPAHVTMVDNRDWRSNDPNRRDPLADEEGIRHENQSTVHLSGGKSIEVMGSVVETAAQLAGTPDELRDDLFWATRRIEAENGATAAEFSNLVRLAGCGEWEELRTAAQPIARRALKWAQAHHPSEAPYPLGGPPGGRSRNRSPTRLRGVRGRPRPSSA